MKRQRGILIAGNWKMNQDQRETGLFFSALREISQSLMIKGGPVKICLAPPFLSLERAIAEASQLPFPVEIAAQNAHWEKSGAFTGEVSGPMLQQIGVHTVLIGHSERRQFFGETDASVRMRIESLLEQGFQVIFCIGETLKEREESLTQSVLTRQIDGAIPHPGEGAARYLNGQLILAYEPVWAIGTGLTATPTQAEETHQFIRNHLRERFGINASERTPILYGGSVTPENIDSLLAAPNIDGALVGGASLKPDRFLKLIHSAGEIA